MKSSRAMMITLSKGVLILTTGFVLFVIVRTILLKTSIESPVIKEALNSSFPISIAEGLSEAIRYATISHDRSSGKELNHTAFRGLNQYIFKRYSGILEDPPSWITHTIIANYSILIHVRGQNPDLKPYMLCAHLDVVPVDEKLWTHPPFAGYMDETYVWGRGALDDKHNLMAILEALTYRVERKNPPQRGFYIALGHDEEVRGLAGAKVIAQRLAAEKVELEFILDEGLVILKKGIPGIGRPIALIGVAEKGYVTVRVKCVDVARHSSIPSQETAITTLARALTRFTGNSHPAHLTELQDSLIKEVAPFANFPFDFIYLNLWLFKPIVSYQMAKMDNIAAQMRTTTAVTLIRGGLKENVIPNEAEALVNHRILPGYSTEDVLKYDRDLVKDIPTISVDFHQESMNEAVPSSPYDESSLWFQAIKTTTQEIYPDALVAPSLMVANTDTKHYFEANLTKNIYRYSPVQITFADASTIHGNNEKISKLNFQRMADFYLQLIRNCDGETTTGTTTKRTDL